MAGPLDRDRALEVLGGLIRTTRVAILTTVGPDSTLRGRPLLLQRYDPDGVLWFLTHGGSAKVDEMTRDPRVHVGFSDPGHNGYVCGTGTVEVVRDRGPIGELWSDIYREFFPEGPDDPNVVLLRVRLSRAEFWDAPRLTDPWVAGIVAMSDQSPPEAHGVVEF